MHYRETASPLLLPVQPQLPDPLPPLSCRQTDLYQRELQEDSQIFQYRHQPLIPSYSLGFPSLRPLTQLDKQTCSSHTTHHIPYSIDQMNELSLIVHWRKAGIKKLCSCNNQLNQLLGNLQQLQLILVRNRSTRTL
jgi:hypothetical protein